MANVICHIHNSEKVRNGDTVRGPAGEPMTVHNTLYAGRQGALVWTREDGEAPIKWSASEVGCYVTSRDDA